MIYAGIGSRKTPESVLGIMRRIGVDLAQKGHTLRSGGAEGADKAFEEGAKSVNGKMEIFLPNGGNKNLWFWKYWAKKYHPAWDKLGEYAKQCHARNIAIMLGEEGDSRADFVLCWTPNAELSGGTGQSMRIAQSYGIPIYNLFYKHTSEWFLHDLESGKFKCLQ